MDELTIASSSTGSTTAVRSGQCGFFALGLGYYSYTYLTTGRFTNMSALLFVTSVLVFLIGLVSEQITALIYKDNGDHSERGSSV